MRNLSLRSLLVFAVAAGIVACGGDDPLETELYEYPGDADATGGNVVADDVERVVIAPQDFELEFRFDVIPSTADTECRITDEEVEGDWFDCSSPFSLGPDSEEHHVREGHLVFEVRAIRGQGEDRENGQPDSIETLVLFDFDFWFDGLDPFDDADQDHDFGFPDEYQATCTRNENYDGDYTIDGDYVPDDCELNCQWTADELDAPVDADCSFDDPFELQFPDDEVEFAFLEVEACADNFREHNHCKDAVSYLFYPSPAEWLELSAGEAHTCGIIEDDSLWCWGRNAAGQLGTGDTSESLVATEIGTDIGAWSTVSAGYNHTCAIDTGGALYCWGANTDGQLGDPGLDSADEPQLIDDANQWDQVSAGVSHTCAIDADEQLYCWGDGRDGQLGIGDTTSYDEPTPLADSGWLDVAAGEEHTCGIRVRADGVTRGYCWGDADRGRLGNSRETGQYVTPQEIDITSSLQFHAGTLTVGEEHSCAVIADDAYCWGRGRNGRLGYGEDDQRVYPERIENSEDYSALAAGLDHTCGVDADNTVRCWGGNRDGQLGNDSDEDSNSPVQVIVPDNEPFADVTAGEEYTCGIDTSGVAYCWGLGEDGRLGSDATDALGTATEIAWPQGRLVPTPREDLHSAEQ